MRSVGTNEVDRIYRIGPNLTWRMTCNTETLPQATQPVPPQAGRGVCLSSGKAERRKSVEFCQSCLIPED